MADISEVTLDNFDSEVLQAEGSLLVYFYAPWCKPCQEMEETVQAVSEEVAEKMRVVRVNTDKEAEIVAQQKIQTIPLFQVMEKGKPVELIRGPLSKLELLGKLGSLIFDEEDGGPSSDDSEGASQESDNSQEESS